MKREHSLSQLLRRLAPSWRWRGQTRLRQLVTSICLRSDETLAPIGDIAFPFLKRHWPFYFGLYEQNNIAFLRRWLRAGDVFLDVGANVGYFAAVASDVVGPSGSVHAFEPEPGHYRRLAHLAALNPKHAITTHSTAVMDKDGEVDLFISEHAGHHSIQKEFGQESRATSTVVQATRLDTYCRTEGLDRPGAIRLVKVDVEGAELEVVKGAAELIKNHWAEAVLMEVSPGISLPELGELMAAHGVQSLSIGEGAAAFSAVDIAKLTQQQDVLWVLDSAVSEF